MIVSRSIFRDIRGLRYHFREWGNPTNPPLLFLHGWMDVSASFQFTVDELSSQWRVISPDWRGFGRSEWAMSDYWFSDYIADLDCIVDKLFPSESIAIVGHSMGGNIGAFYAGIKPHRVKKLILAEGFGIRRKYPKKTLSRYTEWLDHIKNPRRFRKYETFDEVGMRIMKNTPKISLKNALFLAKHWAKKDACGLIELRADPKHKNRPPNLLSIDEILEVWKKITCPVLWLYSDSDWLKRFMKDEYCKIDEYRKCFKQLEEIVIKNSSHMMHLDQPKILATVIEKFLSKS